MDYLKVIIFKMEVYWDIDKQLILNLGEENLVRTGLMFENRKRGKMEGYYTRRNIERICYEIDDYS
jgi:hypothetical protein